MGERAPRRDVGVDSYQLVVRRADHDDLEAIADIARSVRDELTASKGGAVWRLLDARPDPIEASLQRDLDDGDAEVAVGTVDDVVVGYGVARTGRGPHLIASVDDVAVLSDARGIGVGAAVLEHLVAWCAARGCVGIDSLVLPGMRESKNFFEAASFVARAIVVHHTIVEHHVTVVPPTVDDGAGNDHNAEGPLPS